MEAIRKWGRMGQGSGALWEMGLHGGIEGGGGSRLGRVVVGGSCGWRQSGLASATHLLPNILVD